MRNKGEYSRRITFEDVSKFYGDVLGVNRVSLSIPPGITSLVGPAHRKIAGYSKGMRQRIKLAQSTCHGPSVLVLDEPLNGLDPLVRAETIALFKMLAEDGMHVILSSHVLHEVDAISDQVILLSNGYVVAEGKISGVREEIQDHPMQILIRCSKPGEVASKMFQQEHVIEARIHKDGAGLLIKTRDANKFY